MYGSDSVPEPLTMYTPSFIVTTGRIPKQYNQFPLEKSLFSTYQITLWYVDKGSLTVAKKYENNLNVIGAILRKKRKEKKLSFEQLSNKLLLLGINIPVTCLHRIENNQRTVRDYELCALSIALDIDIKELVNPFINNIKNSEKN